MRFVYGRLGHERWKSRDTSSSSPKNGESASWSMILSGTTARYAIAKRSEIFRETILFASRSDTNRKIDIIRLADRSNLPTRFR